MYPRQGLIIKITLKNVTFICLHRTQTTKNDAIDWFEELQIYLLSLHQYNDCVRLQILQSSYGHLRTEIIGLFRTKTFKTVCVSCFLNIIQIKYTYYNSKIIKRINETCTCN